MAFDFKKEFKEYYLPPCKPEIVTVPPANFIAVRGSGNPNDEDGEYNHALNILYAVAYTLKMRCCVCQIPSPAKILIGRCQQPPKRKRLTVLKPSFSPSTTVSAFK